MSERLADEVFIKPFEGLHLHASPDPAQDCGALLVSGRWRKRAFRAASPAAEAPDPDDGQLSAPGRRVLVDGSSSG
ncbi:MAG: hypothetical protein ACOC3I_07335 [Verrucomicrobiota bacterium]